MFVGSFGQFRSFRLVVCTQWWGGFGSLQISRKATCDWGHDWSTGHV